jgi:hypothetical protein
VDLMEDRTLLSTLTVTNNHDSGPGSLRAALAAATSGETINFANSLTGQTITLTSGELTIAKSPYIDGLGAGRLTVSSGGGSRVFAIAAGADVTLSGLTIAHGSAAQGGGIDNFGTLTVYGCTLLNNKAVGGSGDSTTPKAANGGGIANEVGASLTLIEDLLTNNVAGASPGNDSFGGGLLNLGSATIANSTFTGNQSTGGASTSYFNGSWGGAIVSFGYPPNQLYGSTLSVSNSTFTDNQAIGASGNNNSAGGGAIDLEFGVIATISNSSFTGNQGSGDEGCNGNGGAINTEGCTLTLSNSSFAGNQAIGGHFNGSLVAIGDDALGGAILMDTSNTTVTLTNCTLTGNLSIGGDGASASAYFAD